MPQSPVPSRCIHHQHELHLSCSLLVPAGTPQLALSWVSRSSRRVLDMAQNSIFNGRSTIWTSLLSPTLLRRFTRLSAVWNALVDPAIIKQYMFGTTVTSDWKEGSPIVWKGEWQGKPYEDKGVILRMQPHASAAVQPFQPVGRAAGHAGELSHRHRRAGRAARRHARVVVAGQQRHGAVARALREELEQDACGLEEAFSKSSSRRTDADLNESREPRASEVRPDEAYRVCRRVTAMFCGAGCGYSRNTQPARRTSASPVS